MDKLLQARASCFNRVKSNEPLECGHYMSCNSFNACLAKFGFMPNPNGNLILPHGYGLKCCPSAGSDPNARQAAIKSCNNSINYARMVCVTQFNDYQCFQAKRRFKSACYRSELRSSLCDVANAETQISCSMGTKLKYGLDNYDCFSAKRNLSKYCR